MWLSGAQKPAPPKRTGWAFDAEPIETDHAARVTLHGEERSSWPSSYELYRSASRVGVAAGMGGGGG